MRAAAAPLAVERGEQFGSRPNADKRLTFRVGGRQPTFVEFDETRDEHERDEHEDALHFDESANWRRQAASVSSTIDGGSRVESANQSAAGVLRVDAEGGGLLKCARDEEIGGEHAARRQSRASTLVNSRITIETNL